MNDFENYSERNTFLIYFLCFIVSVILISDIMILLGADVDVRSRFGYHATDFSHLDVAKLIAKKDPKVLNARTDFGETPLFWARVRNHHHIVNWLTSEMNATE